MENVYLGRQPILDSDGRLSAYEVLYRNSHKDSDITDDRFASAAVLNSILSKFGVQTLLGSYKAFVKIDEKFLLNDLIFSIPHEFFIFSLFEDIEMNLRVVERLKQLKKRGYDLAINDVVIDSEILHHYKDVLDEISYIKIDIKECKTSTLKEAITHLKSKNLKIVCTKIEDNDHYEMAKELGCDLFQGYYFAKPKIIENKKCEPGQLNVIKLYNLLMEDANIDEITSAFEKNHQITVQLLQFVNSGAFHFRSQISSIHHVLTLVGRRPLAQWLMLMIYSKSVAKNNEFSPLMLMAVNRTKLMEYIYKAVKPKAGSNELGEAYFVGILSLIDTIFGVKLEEILKHIHVSKEISNALLKDEGVLGEIYVLVRDIESFNIQAIVNFNKKYHLSSSAINIAVLDSMEDVNNFNNKVS